MNFYWGFLARYLVGQLLELVDASLRRGSLGKGVGHAEQVRRQTKLMHVAQKWPRF